MEKQEEEEKELLTIRIKPAYENLVPSLSPSAYKYLFLPVC
jgi:hypothetical protein